MLARFAGFLQPLEWRAFDLSLRWRPAEAADSRITIVELTESDIQDELGYPISDQALAQLLQTLQTYQPRAIGVDIFRDIPVGEGQQQLASVLESSSNIIGISSIFYPFVPAHPSLSESQIGFVDAPLDDDGYLRRNLLGSADDVRNLLGSADEEGNYRFSLTIRLVEQYLAPDGLILENGIKDPETMRFGSTEIPRFMPYTGGYIRADNGGNQALINFRSGSTPFDRLSYAQVVSGSLSPELINDRIVLIGYTAESVKDFVSSAAVISKSASLVSGTEVQAHAVSQILSAVYDDRPFLTSLPEFVEYLFILGGGFLGIALSLWQRKPALHWLLAIAIGTSWLLICYGLIIASWWLPLIPTLVAFSLNAVGLYPLYQTKAQLKAQIEERRTLINWTYNTIHNGPLQILVGLLSNWPANEPPPTETRARLEKLNKELRSLHESMRQEMLIANGTLVMTGQRTIDLQTPLDAILYETYQATLERQRSFFQKIIQITTFESMPDKKLTVEQKREIARFLEESLINVYKYAKTATKLLVDCRQEGEFNIVRITDNAKETQTVSARIQEFAKESSGQKAYGTQQAKRLARQLGGQFNRTTVQPRGVCCELRWPAQPSGLIGWLK